MVSRWPWDGLLRQVLLCVCQTRVVTSYRLNNVGQRPTTSLDFKSCEHIELLNPQALTISISSRHGSVKNGLPSSLYIKSNQLTIIYRYLGLKHSQSELLLNIIKSQVLRVCVFKLQPFAWSPEHRMMSNRKTWERPLDRWDTKKLLRYCKARVHDRIGKTDEQFWSDVAVIDTSSSWFWS